MSAFGRCVPPVEATVQDALNLTIGCEVDELIRLCDAVGTFLDQHDADPRTAYRVRLVVEEAVSNVIKYGQAGSAPRTLDVAVVCQKPTFVIRIEDDGHPFDPTLAASPDLDVPIEDRRVGGLGLHLIRSMADDATYERRDNRNIFVLHVQANKED